MYDGRTAEMLVAELDLLLRALGVCPDTEPLVLVGYGMLFYLNKGNQREETKTLL